MTTATAPATAPATTLATGHGIAAPLNKKGVTTLQGRRAATILNNMDLPALHGAARDGRGVVGKLALNYALRDAKSLNALLQSPLTGDPRIDGRAYSNVKGLIHALHGHLDSKTATETAIRELVTAITNTLIERVRTAETDAQTERAEKALNQWAVDSESVTLWLATRPAKP